jgi:hypothetical protein
VNQLLQEDKPGYSPVVIVDKTPVVVKNDRSTMVGNSLVWEYDLEGPIGKPAKVSLSLNIDGKKYDWKDLDIKGDVGEVFPGVGKRVWWNILKDFPGNISKNIDWELSAEE